MCSYTFFQNSANLATLRKLCAKGWWKMSEMLPFFGGWKDRFRNWPAPVLIPLPKLLRLNDKTRSDLAIKARKKLNAASVWGDFSRSIHKMSVATLSTSASCRMKGAERGQANSRKCRQKIDRRPPSTEMTTEFGKPTNELNLAVLGELHVRFLQLHDQTKSSSGAHILGRASPQRLNGHALHCRERTMGGRSPRKRFRLTV